MIACSGLSQNDQIKRDTLQVRQISTNEIKLKKVSNQLDSITVELEKIIKQIKNSKK